MPRFTLKTLFVLLFLTDIAWANGPDAGPSQTTTPVALLPQVGQPSTSAPTEHRWYGWQNLAVGLPGAGLLALGRQSSDKSGGTVSFFSGYPLVLLGPPIVHWSHGHVAKGFASMGINAVSIAAFALTIPTSCTTVNSEGSGESCDADVRDLMPIGAVIGALVGVSIDAAFLAHDEVPLATPKPLQVVPQATATRHGFTVGLSGAF